MIAILLGQLPEAIFFALFMIFAKNIHTKRLLFTLMMIMDYLLLMQLFPYDWVFHILFTITTFILLKVFYKEKSQITDVFILIISYIYVIITSAICFIICNENIVVASLINRLMLFIPLLVCNYRLYAIQDLYKRYWNRNDKIKRKMKATTFRSLNVVIFNFLFVVINLGMLFATYYNNITK